MKIFKGAIPLILAGIAMFSGQVWAAPILVNNFSFEDPPDQGNAAAAAACPNSWTCSPAANGGFNVGYYSPVSTTQYNNNGSDGLASGHSVPDDGSARTNTSNTSGGYQALYINFNSGGETVSQNTAALIANDTTYTLDVWVGHRADLNWGNAIIELLANGVVWQSLSLADPTAGAWADHSLIFTTGASDIHAGQTLGIALVDNLNAGNTQTNFDLVTLDATPQNVVPEPTTLLLLGTGFVALGLFGRRQGRMVR